MRLCHLSQRHVGVLGIGRLVVFLFSPISIGGQFTSSTPLINQSFVSDNKLPDNKLYDNILASELVGNRSFLNQSQLRKL